MSDSQNEKQRDLELANEQAAQEAREIEEEEALREADDADWYSNQDSIHNRDAGKRGYTTTQASTVLGVDQQDIEGWLEVGRLRGSRNGREWVIPVEEIALAYYALRLHREEDVEIEMAFGRAANEDRTVATRAATIKRGETRHETHHCSPAETHPSKGGLLSVQEAAFLSGIAFRTLDEWAWTGSHGLPVVRIGRRRYIDRSDLEAWIKKHTRHGRPLTPRQERAYRDPHGCPSAKKRKKGGHRHGHPIAP